MKTLFAVLTIFVTYGLGANILVMLPLSTFSHTNAYLPIFTELAKRGHNMTVVSPYPQKKPIPNYHDIVITNTLEIVTRGFGTVNLRQFNNILTSALGLWAFSDKFLKPVFELPELMTFINTDNSKFDLVILEPFFCQEPFIALGHKYAVPVIAITPTAITSSIAAFTGNPYPNSYVPAMKLPYSDHMTFWERVTNTFVNTAEYIGYRFIGIRKLENMMRENVKYPGSEKMPPLTDMLSNLSLILVDNHLSLSYPRPYLPNIIEFGGLSVKEADQLPADLEKYMQDSKDGVVFFTWGSHFKLTNIEPKLLSIFMSALGKLKQRVIIKWENETLPGKPDNVLTLPWLPQASILGHPKLKLFITHGGIHGVTEAVYHGVPMLGTPLFGDQLLNLKLVENAGMAISVEIDHLTEEHLSQTLQKLLNDPSYKENALKKKNVMRDRPMNALDTAAFWIEYVIRHKGAEHLRPASLDLAWYQYHLLDVIAFYLTVFIATSLLSVFLLRFCCRLCKRKKVPHTHKKSKKSGKKND